MSLDWHFCEPVTSPSLLGGHVRFIVEYPVVSTPGAGWLEPASITGFARAVEEAGLDGIGFTDHPAPSLKWLNGGGHETLDPFAALGFCAAVTTRIRLLTWLSVVPYRNPFLAAKSMTTVDLLSGGRATFALGSGYLRSEFAALGVDFSERNDLFEESVRVIKATWTGDEVSFEGRHFKAIGQVGRPRPVQRPHPPLWIGGNSAVARDRVARLAQGWAPMLGPKLLARTTRTPAIESTEELGRLVEDLARRLDSVGRNLKEIDIVAGAEGGRLTSEMSGEQRLESFAEIERIGVTVTSVQVPRDSVQAATEAVARFGQDVLGQ
jgi:probable F420-dependent oxidoreductase